MWRVRVNQPTGLGHVLTDLNRAPWGSPVGTRACEVKPLSRGDIGTVGVQSRGASAPTVCPLARPVERLCGSGACPIRSAQHGGISNVLAVSTCMITVAVMMMMMSAVSSPPELPFAHGGGLPRK